MGSRYVIRRIARNTCIWYRAGDMAAISFIDNRLSTRLWTRLPFSKPQRRPAKLRALAGALTLVLATGVPASAAPQLYSWAGGYSVSAQTTTVTSGTAMSSNGATTTSAGAPVSHEESAYATFGRLGVYAEASAGSNGVGGTNWGDARARFQDDITVFSDGMEGQSGLLTFLIEVDGTLSSDFLTPPIYEDFSSYALAGLTITQNGSSVYSSIQYDYATGATSGSFLNTPIQVEVPFTFGTAFTLSFTLRVVSQTTTLNGANSVSDLGHTLTWEGVSSVTAGGNPVTDYTMASASGTNYLSPIPEPASAALVVAAGLLAGLRRSRRARTVTGHA
jgi:hypothetical protein